jgi:hypothetical protein
VTVGGATGAESLVAVSTTQPVSIPGGAANLSNWPPSTLNAATSVPVMVGATTPAVGVMYAVRPFRSNSGVN